MKYSCIIIAWIGGASLVSALPVSPTSLSSTTPGNTLASLADATPVHARSLPGDFEVLSARDTEDQIYARAPTLKKHRQGRNNHDKQRAVEHKEAIDARREDAKVSGQETKRQRKERLAREARKHKDEYEQVKLDKRVKANRGRPKN